MITHDTGRRLGCYGASVSTPHLDRVAAEGTRFSQSFCTAPQCSPSRGALITGRYPHQNGLMGLAHLGWHLHAGERCLGHHLADAGYETVLCGLQHEDADAARLGYQRVVGRRRDAAGVAESVAGVLSDRGAGRPPLFLMAGMNETHRPFDGPAYRSDAPAEERVPPYLPDVPEVRQELAQFGGLVRAVDDAVGVIAAAMQRGGLAERTILIYTTDHGIAFPRAKGMAYDPGLETALLLRWPGRVPAGRVDGHLVSHVDLLPTLLEAAGAPLPAGLAGRSLLPLWTGAPQTPRDHVFFEETWHDRYNPLRGVRTERFKYIRSFDPGAPEVYLPADIYRSPSGAAVRDACYAVPRVQEELYDLKADPGERRNLAGDPGSAAVLSDLRNRVEEWMERTDDPLRSGPVPPPAKQAEMLAAAAREGRLTGPLTDVERLLLGAAGVLP